VAAEVVYTWLPGQPSPEGSNGSAGSALCWSVFRIVVCQHCHCVLLGRRSCVLVVLQGWVACLSSCQPWLNGAAAGGFLPVHDCQAQALVAGGGDVSRSRGRWGVVPQAETVPTVWPLAGSTLAVQGAWRVLQRQAALLFEECVVCGS
jgi:hypothetical protein